MDAAAGAVVAGCADDGNVIVIVKALGMERRALARAMGYLGRCAVALCVSASLVKDDWPAAALTISLDRGT